MGKERIERLREAIREAYECIEQRYGAHLAGDLETLIQAKIELTLAVYYKFDEIERDDAEIVTHRLTAEEPPDEN